MKWFSFFILPLAFAPLFVFAQTYPYDKSDVDAFVIEGNYNPEMPLSPTTEGNPDLAPPQNDDNQDGTNEGETPTDSQTPSDSGDTTASENNNGNGANDGSQPGGNTEGESNGNDSGFSGATSGGSESSNADGNTSDTGGGSGDDTEDDGIFQSLLNTVFGNDENESSNDGGRQGSRGEIYTSLRQGGERSGGVPRQISIEEIMAAADLTDYVQLAIDNDTALESAFIDERTIVVEYKQSARLFGIFKIGYTQKVAVSLTSRNSLGSVEIDKPWWTMFTTGDSTKELELQIRKEVTQLLLDNPDLSEQDIASFLQRLASLFTKLVEILRTFRENILGTGA